MSQKILYSLRKSRRAKSLRVSVYQDGRCVVTAPTFLGQGMIDGFVRAKSHWISEKLREFMPFRPIVRKRNSRKEFLKHKERAREVVMKYIPELNKVYGFNVGRIAIRNQKTRWGSCSTKGNLNFNYRIALLPEHLARYIIAHELCHLGEFNHSKKFWDLVAQTVPEYKQFQRELKGRGLSVA